jgi:hypothetical protein
MNEILKFLKYKLRKSLRTDIWFIRNVEHSPTWHGNPKADHQLTNNRSASPESHYKHYYITLCHVLYFPVLSHSITTDKPQAARSSVHVCLLALISSYSKHLFRNFVIFYIGVRLNFIPTITE